ncbi:sigma-70 family RNA polymerase sigma factor [Leifsonia sp. 22587]|uniref:sigma-70 family RNA polymerase sigma factor n=1 Tax=Leifsonia sp. 22587 TaxID=3453946 RepID=UPI003F8782FC
MTHQLDDLSDADLLARAREKDAAAYGVLWKRHWNAARGMAASITNRFEADDLASEAFARILKAVEKGKGPQNGFRSYLASTVRNVAIDWSRRKASPNLEDPDALEDWSYSELTALDKIERETIAKAFYALPDSWQEVLWYTQVEEMSPRDIAPLLGLSPNAVSALAVRAREGLRQTWINAHLAEAGPGDPVHAWTIKRLGSHVRGRLSKTDRRRLLHHLQECSSCSDAAGEADRVGSRLALAILPLVLGVGGAAAYTEWVHGSNAAVASTLPSALPSLPGGGVKGLLTAASQHPGLTTVAATAASSSPTLASVATSVMVAAVLTAGTVLGSQPAEPALGESVSALTDTQTPSAQADPVDAVEPAEPAPEDPGAVPEEDQGGVAEVPADEESTPSDADEVEADGTEVDNTEVDNTEVDNTEETGGTETSPIDAGPPSSTPAREAAIRSVPADDTLLAYRLDDGAAPTAVDFVHEREARYDRPDDAGMWSLCEQTRRDPADVFSIQIWFKTAVGGGRLIGYSDSERGPSAHYDRHLFLADDGRVVFGVFPGAVHTVASARSYADDRWHQATATLSPAGMALYVDGEPVASDPSVTHAEGFAGFWRVGYDTLGNWGPDTPSRYQFSGELAYATVYSVALTPAQIQAQWELSD